MVVKRSITLAGHRTSLSLEQPFWDELQAIAAKRRISLARLVGEIDAARLADAQPANLSSSLRISVLKALKADANKA